MGDRGDVRSGLDGPGPAEEQGRSTDDSATSGLGRWPSSRAGLGRRLGGVFVDWALCTLIAAGLFQVPLVGARSGIQSWIPLLIFAVENVLLVATAGQTIGHRLFGLQVRAVTGARAGWLASTIRALLLCLVIPAVVWDRDGRGLHDRAASTVLLRR